MRIFVTGGTGFIGTPLVRSLADKGHEIIVLLRENDSQPASPGVKYVSGDPFKKSGVWDAIPECDAAINLAGEPIQGRWTSEKKKAIRDSRVITTENLVNAIPRGKEFTLISTSAVGIYGDAGERECLESSPAGNDFLASVAKEWESKASAATEKGTRVVITRFGVVLGPNGGALRELERLTRQFLGGPIAGGKHWFSWIQREDLISAEHFLLESKHLGGVFNVCSPHPIRQGEFAKALGTALGKPAITPTPGFAVRLVLGEAADFVLFSQKMLPKRLQGEGFSWRYPTVAEALKSIYSPLGS